MPRRSWRPSWSPSMPGEAACLACGRSNPTYECGAGHVFCRPCARGPCQECSLPPTPDDLTAGFERVAAAWKDRFTGRLICATGTIDYEGEIGKQTTFTVTT